MAASRVCSILHATLHFLHFLRLEAGRLLVAERHTADGSIMGLLHLSCQIVFSAFLKTYRGERESHKAVLLMAS